MDAKSTPQVTQVVRCSRRTQYLGSFFVLLLSLVDGALIGWSSPSFPILQSLETPLASGPMNIDEISWVASLLGPSALLGTFYYIWMVNKCGRKWATYSIAAIQILAWLLIVMAIHPYFLAASKFLNGFSCSGVFIVCPIYLAEISEASIRGFIGSLFGLTSNVGILLAFTVGSFMDCLMVPWIFLPLNLTFLIGFSFFPETPYFYALRGKFMNAEKSLRFYRGVASDKTSDSITYELGVLKSTSFESAERNCKTKVKLRDFKIKSVRRSLTIGMGLCVIQQLSGVFAMINYTALIFEDSGSSLSPNVSTIIVGLIQVLGSYIATLLVDRAGRKILLILSALGTGLCLALFGTFSYFVDHPDYDQNFVQFKSIPLISFSLAIFFANCGIVNLPFLVLAEILPLKFKAFGTTLCYSVWNIMSFLVIKHLPIVMEDHGMYVPIYVFSTVCFLGALFVYFCQPETKGKTFIEIIELLDK